MALSIERCAGEVLGVFTGAVPSTAGDSAAACSRHACAQTQKMNAATDTTATWSRSSVVNTPLASAV